MPLCRRLGDDMITYVVCDLFTSPARTLVNTVNTVGVMGKGIAKDFKTIYPEMFARYQELCERKQFDIGQLWLYRTPNKWVLNFPTKEHWRYPSHPDYIEAGLRKFVATYHMHGITSISFPQLGCGNGELDWESQVRPLMEQYLVPLPMDVYIHLFDKNDSYSPEYRSIREIKKWLRSEPESLAFSELWSDLLVAIAADPNVVEASGKEASLVSVDSDERTLTFEHSTQSFTVADEDMMDLWQQLRGAGFACGDNFPSGLDSHSGWIIPLLTRLPYLQPVNMREHIGFDGEMRLGLRIQEPGQGSSHADLPLLAGIGAVEPE